MTNITLHKAIGAKGWLTIFWYCVLVRVCMIGVCVMAVWGWLGFYVAWHV